MSFYENPTFIVQCRQAQRYPRVVESFFQALKWDYPTAESRCRPANIGVGLMSDELCNRVEVDIVLHCGYWDLEYSISYSKTGLIWWKHATASSQFELPSMWFSFR